MAFKQEQRWGARTVRPSPGNCPVCRAPDPVHFMTLQQQDYWRCETCKVRFLGPAYWLRREAERAYYELHENAVGDPHYRRFLSKLADPLLAELKPGSRGLDYGCGPGPALADMLRAAGHAVALYDPFFQPDEKVLAGTYEFITCTEVVEHFHHPGDEFDKLNAMLRPGGVLAVMTCFQTDDARFANWHYRKDPTHVVFYREETLRMIAAQRGWGCKVPVKDVAIMRKPVARL